jgi:hypothetical protein
MHLNKMIELENGVVVCCHKICRTNWEDSSVQVVSFVNSSMTHPICYKDFNIELSENDDNLLSMYNKVSQLEYFSGSMLE